MARTIIKVILGLIPGVVIGAVLVVLTAGVLASTRATAVNGWITVFGCGEPGNGALMRMACAEILPAVNVPQEAVYWTTTRDGARQTLNGQHDYTLHFPAGGLPPNSAFWSLTMGDAQNHFVPNPINRYSVGDRSGLVANADGSVDIYIQNAAPAGLESNWLPAPTGDFHLWLRVYLPGATVVDGKYTVPAVQEVQ